MPGVKVVANIAELCRLARELGRAEALKKEDPGAYKKAKEEYESYHMIYMSENRMTRGQLDGKG